MAAIVCHGLQSWLESQLVESTTLKLNLPFSKTLTPPQPIDLAFKTSFRDSNTKPHYSEEISKKTDTHDDNHGWSFLQALSNVNQGPKEPLEKEPIYVHPQVKRSSLVLNERSLELCTENLGNETGTDIVENGIDLLCSSLHCADGDSPTREQTGRRQYLVARKVKARNFPPPLTTIRGAESLRVRPHREDGRLVIEAVRVTSSASGFQAERSHGRLRLCLLKNCTPSFDPEQYDAEENEPISEGFEEELESEMNEQRQKEEEQEEEAEETEEEAEEEEDVEDGEDINGDSWKSGGEMRMGKYEKPRRCKEGEHENYDSLNWEPLWVTTTS